MFGQQRTGTKVFTVPLKALMFFFARVSIRNYNNSPSPGSTRTDHTINESDVESLKHHVSIIVGEFLRHPLPDNSCKNLEVVLQCRCCCSHERGDPLLLFLFPHLRVCGVGPSRLTYRGQVISISNLLLSRAMQHARTNTNRPRPKYTNPQTQCVKFRP